MMRKMMTKMVSFEIMEAFHTIKEQYRQIFLISHESETEEMFERGGVVKMKYDVEKVSLSPFLFLKTL